MAANSTELMMDKDEPMQTEPIYLSGEENTETQYPMSDQELRNEKDEQWLNQIVINPNDPTNTVQNTIPTYDVKMPTISSSATTESQQSKHKHIVSTATA